MARITGRNGALYADASAGASGSASKVAFMKHYTINGTRDKTDVTAFGDGTKVYIAGLADASGTADGFYDDESNDIYTIADGVARKFYKYVDDTDANTRKPISGGDKGYWYGTAIFDVSTDVAVDNAATTTLNWAASTTVYKV